jgi:hypothetical protein
MGASIFHAFMNRRVLPAVSALLLLSYSLQAQQPATPAPKPATPAPRPATPAPAVFTGQLSIVRYDLPIGFSNGLAPTRQQPKRKDAPDAVDWPDFTLNGQPIFRGKTEERIPLKYHKGADAASYFQMPGDDVIQPGGHWLRAMEWRGNRRHIYTADCTARSSNSGESMTGRYELWLFPISIQGEGGPVVKNVELKAAGAVIYHKAGPWRALTLLLPQNEPGKPYELAVDGRPPVKFQAGVQPFRLGHPQEILFPLKTTVPGEGPKITVECLTRPEEFPHPKEWAADLAALAKPLPPAPAVEKVAGLRRYLGIQTPFSPLTIYAAALPHGMSGGFFAKGTKPEEYAAFIADLGLDTIFDPATTLPAPSDPESFERRGAELGRRGVRFGLQYDQNWNRPSLQHPNLTFFAHTLPDWHSPLYRSVSLATQRFARMPNFAGLNIGSDNAGYACYWSWAPPIPDRPWGEGMIAFFGSPQPKVPVPPSLGPREFAFEEPVKTEVEFTRYVEHYDTSFREYGYFAEAVREINPGLTFTTGSYGSSPGTGGRGGWPWASIPGRVMFQDLVTQQAYDWNETHASKPLHNVALVDRIRSYSPKKKTWTIIDNFRLLYGRETFQRACALALTRGIQGIGANFLPNRPGYPPQAGTSGDESWQREMNAWMRKYGGVYAHTEPTPVIGIFFGQLEAVQRRILQGENVSEAQLLEGSQEGKVTEALFLCHAAGWPARVITYQELLRESLPASMKAILLVGLDQPDATWNWGKGIEPRLQQFLSGGGRILADDQSVCPVPSTKTGLKIAAYVPESNMDATPLLLARNTANISILRAAMNGVPEPIAVSDNPKLWAIPTHCAETQYVTAVNQAFAEGEEAAEMLRPADPKAVRPEAWKTKGNASLYVKPQTGALRWNTDRPIYDVRLGRKITPEEAASVDLTQDAFRWYALPPGEVTKPEVVVEKNVSGFYNARVTMHGAGPMGGIPVQITVTGPQDSATVYSTTETDTRLPLSIADPGDYLVTATELLTGLSESAHVTTVQDSKPALKPAVRVRDSAGLAKFVARKSAPLTVALTPEQSADPGLAQQAKALVAFYRQQGRAADIRKIEPGDVVESLQPLRSPNRYPQWKTISSDLVLFGTPANNVLLFDQARGQIFPQNLAIPAAGQAEIIYTRSPFVGEYNAVNVIANDAAGIAAAVQLLTTPPKK